MLSLFCFHSSLLSSPSFPTFYSYETILSTLPLFMPILIFSFCLLYLPSLPFFRFLGLNYALIPSSLPPHFSSLLSLWPVYPDFVLLLLLRVILSPLFLTFPNFIFFSPLLFLSPCLSPLHRFPYLHSISLVSCLLHFLPSNNSLTSHTLAFSAV